MMFGCGILAISVSMSGGSEARRDTLGATLNRCLLSATNATRTCAHTHPLFSTAMNGPPTPPLAPGDLPSDPIPAPVVSTPLTAESTAQASTSAPSAESTSAASPSVLVGNDTSYFIAFAQISILTASGDWSNLVEACERAELEVCSLK